MPTYSYCCEACSVEFDELLLSRKEIQQYEKAHPCPECHQLAPRTPATFAFNFAGGVRGISGVNGQSGVHDLDYPSLDKAVARSSEAKWKKYQQEQNKRVQIRREAGTNALSQAGGQVVPADSRVMEDRNKAFGLYRKAKRAESG
jgi:putative FmdB family regulatory protein